MIALAFTATGIQALLAARDQAHERERAAQLDQQAERNRKAATEKQRAELLETLPRKIKTWDAQLDEAARVSDETAAGLTTAIQLTTRVASEIDHAVTAFETPGPSLALLQDESANRQHFRRALNWGRT